MSFPLIILPLIFSLQTSIASSSWSSSPALFGINGTVLELQESNFEAAISFFDYLFVDFYATSCSCGTAIFPELEKAAPILAGLQKPIAVAKVDAEKFGSLAQKHHIGCVPSMMLFKHGVPMDYKGQWNAEVLVRTMKKILQPYLVISKSDSAIGEFIEAAGAIDNHVLPIFIGFGMDESVISNLAYEYREKAWFTVATNFSDDHVRTLYGVDKLPALVSLHPRFNNERHIFHGPFQDSQLRSFIRQNLFPLVVPVNPDTLGDLRQRSLVVLTIMEDLEEEQSKHLIERLKAASSSNREFVFAYAGVNQWKDFTDFFHGTTSKEGLPVILGWEANQPRYSHFALEGTKGGFGEDEQEFHITKFLELLREAEKCAAAECARQILDSDPFYRLFSSPILLYSLLGIAGLQVLLLAMMLLLRVFGKRGPAPRSRGQLQGSNSCKKMMKKLQSSAGKKEN